MRVGIADGEGNTHVGKNVLLGRRNIFYCAMVFHGSRERAAPVEQEASQSRGKRLTAIYEDGNYAKTKLMPSPTRPTAAPPAPAPFWSLRPASQAGNHAS